MNLSKRVGRGAILLDETTPGWWANVDISQLEMSHPWSCILGQISGGHYSAKLSELSEELEKWPASVAKKHGFDLFDMQAIPANFEVLKTLWVEAITERVQAAARGEYLAPERRPATLTLGALRAMTGHLPDSTPLTIDDGEGWYLNLEMTEEAVANHEEEDGQPSIILETAGAVDTRQW